VNVDFVSDSQELDFRWLQDLENFVSTHKDDAKSRIVAVTQSLLNDHIMVGVVTSEVDVYVSRLEQTLDEVNSLHTRQYRPNETSDIQIKSNQIY